MRIKSQIACFDQRGNPLGPPRDIPEPESVPHGLSALPDYLSRLFTSTASFTSLIVTTDDGAEGCGLSRRAHELQILFPLDRHRQAAQEHGIPEFFTRHEIAPTGDSLAQNGGVPDATRILTYPLPDSLESATSLCTGRLVSCLGVFPGDTLHFTFEEE